MRPNIRVEIQNNLAEEAMDVDENEEGEISDKEDSIPGSLDKHAKVEDSNQQNPMPIPDPKKLQERARRFCLNPQEQKTFNSNDLNILYSSLGILPANELNVRFEVIHMRGIEQMMAGDILEYFFEYAPVLVEWIDEECCNVVWNDKVATARALHFMSKAVRGMPVRDDSSYFMDQLQEPEENVSVLHKNREIELAEDEDHNTNKLLNEENSVDISEITATIPPGYWRLGKKHAKTRCLLMRYAVKTDKKCVRIEHLKYNKTKKQEKSGIFGRNKEMKKTENPWSALAKSWDEDAQFREREREEMGPKIEIKNQNLRSRLGKRKEESEEPQKKVKIPRMRMYADEEEEKIKRKKMLQKINHQIKKIDDDKSSSSDLRTVLNMTSRTHGVHLEKNDTESYDLGARLKNRNKKMVFEIKTEKEKRRLSSPSEEEIEEDEYDYGKTRSKVAVVIRTQKKPTVASAVNSKSLSVLSKSESESESSGSESNSSSEEEQEVKKTVARPGFSSQKSRPITEAALKTPLKIEINNDHFKKT